MATITFDAKIKDPLPANTTQVSNQGVVSGANSASVLTDDPGVGGSSDPTVLPVVAVPLLQASKTDTLIADVDGDGVPSPGDLLLYEIVIANSGKVAASGVNFTDFPDPNTTLLVRFGLDYEWNRYKGQ